MTRLSLLLAVLILTAAGSCPGDELRRNPFDHPNLDIPAPAADVRNGVVSDETLRVSAILLAGAESLVSVNGTILGIGEERDGYVLRAVEEEIAVFSRDGKTIAISLFEQPTDDDGV